jgi:hypothetical protein
LPTDALEMRADIALLEGLPSEMTDIAQTPRRKRRKAKLLTFDEIDGRTLAAKRARSIVLAIQSDVGMDLSEAERQLAQRAAVLGAWLEDSETRWIAGQPFDASLYTTVVNCQRRVLETLGIKRVPRDVTSFGDLLRADRAIAAAE